MSARALVAVMAGVLMGLALGYAMAGRMDERLAAAALRVWRRMARREQMAEVGAGLMRERLRELRPMQRIALAWRIAWGRV